MNDNSTTLDSPINKKTYRKLDNKYLREMIAC